MAGTANKPNSQLACLNAAERRHKAVALRRKGFSLVDIAHEMNKEAYYYAGSGSDKNLMQMVSQDIKRVWQEHMALGKQELEEWRELELSRLDELQVALWDTAVAGNVKHILAILAIMDRRAKYLGLHEGELSPPNTVTGFEHQIPRKSREILQKALDDLKARNDVSVEALAVRTDVVDADEVNP